MRVLALAAALVAAPGCRADWQGMKMAPGTPGEAALDNPAKAVLARFLPQRADDEAFQALVDKVLRSSRGQRIARESSQSVGELDAIRQEVQRRGLPSVFIGIPMWESYLDTEAVSSACAAGAWQLMPETAVEFGLTVDSCTIGSNVWTPQPGSVSSPDSPYRLPDGTCGITACTIDERTDLSRSTVAALDLLGRSFDAPDVSVNADRSALAILAYNTGLGAVRQAMSRRFDPFVDLGRCAEGDCDHLGPVGALYVPGVAASAALSTCGAAQSPESPFADEARTTVCRSLEEQGLLAAEEPPAVADAED